jgi:flagellar hook-associated protein 1 FlgK
MKFTVGSDPGVDVTANVDSGSLGGIREARDVDLAKASSDLDAYAYDVASAINQVHSAGVGSDGTGGRNLFVQPTQVAGAAYKMALDPSMVDQPGRLAAAGSAAELPGGNSGALALAKLADAPSFGGATLAGRFAAMASDVGARSASAQSESDFRSQTLATAENFAANASGVSIDEEMTNLTQYQRAFQASSQVLKTVDSLFDSLMAMTS